MIKFKSPNKGYWLNWWLNPEIMIKIKLVIKNAIIMNKNEILMIKNKIPFIKNNFND